MRKAADAYTTVLRGIPTQYHLLMREEAFDPSRLTSLRIGLMVGGRLHGILSRDEFRTSAEAYFEQFREGKLTGPIPVVE